MSNEDIKNCPFCGEEAKKVQTPGSYDGYHLTTIQCQTCFATSTSIEKWNMRAKPSGIGVTINELGLGVRAMNTLKRMDIYHITQVELTPDTRLLGYKNCGLSTLQEIRQAVKDWNLANNK
jgi:DNA-directed RNA polymerase alpha subunit